MAKIKVVCPECARQYSVAESDMGRRARCKKCNAKFVLAQTQDMGGSETGGLGVSKPQGSAYASEDGVPAEWKKDDVILGQYEVRGILGEGGMGRVYDVWHRGWNKRLAVKSPRPDYFKTERQKENFTREAETWIDLGLHPHTVSCFYVRTLGGIPRVFAECIEGGDLKEWIDSKKLYEGGTDEALKRILDIAIQFAWGLGFAHEKNLIHQDVKPANVMLTPTGVAKVTDFGLAKARGEAGESANAGDGQSILASCGGMTPAFCSPEQANMETLTRRTDIWSWALSVLEMFIGEITWPFGVAAPDVLEAYLDDGTQLEGPPPMPEALAELLGQCFEFEQEDRPKSLYEVAMELRAIYRELVESDYFRSEPKAADLMADALNNYGVSLLDLGKRDGAFQRFDQALQVEAYHPEATYNRGLVLWRSGQITDADLVTQLDEVRTTRTGIWRDEYLLGMVHLERGDAESAVKMLEEAQQSGGGLEVQTALDQARRILPDSPRCVRTFEGNIHEVNSVAFSPDGRFCLSGSGGLRFTGNENELRLWDVLTGQCVRTFEGHTKGVNSVAFSPDGRFCLSGSKDTTLRLWDALTGRCLRTFKGHTSPVWSVDFSPDGRFCLSGAGSPLQGWKKILRLWDTSTGQCVRTFEGHTEEVNSAAYSPDGRFCLSGAGSLFGEGRDQTLRLWDASTGRCLRMFEGHIGAVNSVAFSPDGRLCLSGSEDKTLRLWDASTGRCVRTFEGHTKGVNSVAFSPVGRFCLSGGRDGTLRFWDTSTGRCVRTFGHTGNVHSVAFRLDGRFCLSGGWDKTLRLWDVSPCYDKSHKTGAILSRVRDSDEAARIDREFLELLDRTRQAHAAADLSAALEYLKQARSVPGRGLVEKVLDWNHSIGKHCTKRSFSRGWMKRTFEGHAKPVRSVAFSPDGRFCLSGGFGHTPRLWDVSTGQCVRTFEGHAREVRSVAFSPDGRFCLSGSEDKTLRLWDASTGQCVRKFEGHAKPVWSVAFSPDGRFCLSGGFGRTPRLWDVSTGQCVRTFEGHAREVSSVAFSPDGRFCLSGSADSTLRLWDVSTGQCGRTFKGHVIDVFSVAFSPFGRFCLSGGWDKTLRLWDASTGQCVQTFEGHTGEVSSVAFSPDTRFCLSGAWDKTLRLWDVSTGQCVRTFEGHTNSVSSVAFSPDGRFCLSGAWDKTLRLWEFDWEYEFPGWADWDEAARPYIEIFLTRRCPRGENGISRVGRPTWNDKHFKWLLRDLQLRGYGWLREEGVRKKLEEMTANWQGPPPLPGAE